MLDIIGLILQYLNWEIVFELFFYWIYKMIKLNINELRDYGYIKLCIFYELLMFYFF